ncbi:hypothetical protein [Nocardia yamanashiensis]|uniref:hypothetical protein n=1 Tax=Nocardia yamanashiensis TaxID=209247 RepID=UPI000831B9CC|nr:hypothetical protein [Nocardia yamanashiensis]
MSTQPHARHHHPAAPAQPARDLRPVPDPDPLADVVAAIAEHPGTQMLTEIDPENALIEALLNATTAEAADILTLVTRDDLAAHMPRVILTAIAELTHRGRQPSPAAVAAHARGPLGITPQPSHRTIVLYLAQVYTSRIKSDPWAAAARVIEDSYRRSFAEFGARMEQMADQFAPIEDLEKLTGTAVRQWRAMRARVSQANARASARTA